MKQLIIRLVLCSIISAAFVANSILAQVPCGNVSSGGPGQPPGGDDGGCGGCPGAGGAVGGGPTGVGVGPPGGGLVRTAGFPTPAPVGGGTIVGPPAPGPGGGDDCCQPCDENQDVGGVNFFKPYTANAYRRVSDLQIWGGVGGHQLLWKRTYTSRNVGSSKYFFGFQCNWRHSYQWEIADAGGSPPQIDIYYPGGTVNRFKQMSSTNWVGTYAGVKDRVFQNGNIYTLQRRNGFQYVFEKLTNGVYQMQYFKDTMQNQYNFTYTNGLLWRVTEPAGRYFQVSYTNLTITRSTTYSPNQIHTITSLPSSGWNEVTVNFNYVRRYWRYMSPDNSHANVAEIEFIGMGGTNVITGTPFGTDPATTPTNTYDKAFDGDVNTYFDFAGPVRGFTGTDIGASSTNKVGTIRYYPRPGYESAMTGGVFQAFLEFPQTITVITKVETSDGRSVSYDYTLFDDPALPDLRYLLGTAQYGDGTQATYTYTQTMPDSPSLLTAASDPRTVEAAPQIKYEYFDYSSGVHGRIEKELNYNTDAVLATLGIFNNEISRPLVVYPGGTSNTWHMYTGGNVYNYRDPLANVTVFKYDNSNYGFLTNTVDPLGRTINRVPSPYDNHLKIINPDGSTNSWTRDDLDLVTSYTDELGRTTTYTRDGQHRVTRIDYPDASFEEFSYTNFNQVATHRMRNGGIESYVYTTNGLLQTKTDALGNVTTYDYDTSGRLCCVQDARGNETTMEFNERGLVTKITNPDSTYQTFSYDSFGNRTNQVDELGHAWATAYDEFRRVTGRTDPLNRTTSYEYEVGGGGCGSCGFWNQPTKITDPKGNVITYSYDLKRQLVSSTDGNGGTTSWTYDKMGRRTKQTDALNHSYFWAYDSRNRVVAETNALGQTTTYAYDSAGNRTNRVDGDGAITMWSYDSMNRITATGSGSLRYEYGYDEGGRRTSMVTRVNGSITEMTIYTYGARDQLLSKTDPTGYTLSYGYDGVGNRTNLVAALTGGGSAILSQSYAYDTRNRVSSITGNGNTTTYTHDAAGRRIAATWPNGTTATYEYDTANQLTNLAHRTSGGSNIATFAYTYDSAGNRTSMTTLEGLNSYVYNSNNWLVAVDYPDGHSQDFWYDKVGNRTNLMDISTTATNIIAYAYNTANRLTSDSIWTYSYDGVGRLTNQTANGELRTYSYDFRSQMTSLVDTNGSIYTYGFDGDQNRQMENAGSISNRFVYDGANVVLDLDDTNGVRAAYVTGLGIDEPIERIDSPLASPLRYVYHTDALGSVAAVTDSSGATARAYNYEAFGRVRSDTGSLTNRYTFTCRESIADSIDLYYYRARALDPSLGRFISEDPLMFRDGPNLYVYVRNNPLLYIDPSGMGVIDCIQDKLCKAGIDIGLFDIALLGGCLGICVPSGPGWPVCATGCITAILGGNAIGLVLSCL
jgi:RHS repeat-associated protein